MRNAHQAYLIPGTADILLAGALIYLYAYYMESIRRKACSVTRPTFMS